LILYVATIFLIHYSKFMLFIFFIILFVFKWTSYHHQVLVCQRLWSFIQRLLKISCWLTFFYLLKIIVKNFIPNIFS
jgi:hypothetical protein